MQRAIRKWLSILLVSLWVPIVLAQAQPESASALRQENASLRSQLEQLRASCPGSSVGSAVAGEQRVGELGFRILAIRAEQTPDKARATVVLRVRNAGSAPVVLNYLDGSWVLVDEHGHGYALGYSTQVSDRMPHGITTATSRSASGTDVFEPGESRDITFVAGRGTAFREPPGGTTFNFSATFEAIGSGPGGQLRVLRTYPVVFQGVPKS